MRSRCNRTPLRPPGEAHACGGQQHAPALANGPREAALNGRDVLVQVVAIQAQASLGRGGRGTPVSNSPCARVRAGPAHKAAARGHPTPPPSAPLPHAPSAVRRSVRTSSRSESRGPRPASRTRGLAISASVSFRACALSTLISNPSSPVYLGLQTVARGEFGAWVRMGGGGPGGN